MWNCHRWPHVLWHRELWHGDLTSCDVETSHILWRGDLTSCDVETSRPVRWRPHVLWGGDLTSCDVETSHVLWRGDLTSCDVKLLEARDAAWSQCSWKLFAWFSAMHSQWCIVILVLNWVVVTQSKPLWKSVTSSSYCHHTELFFFTLD